MKTCHASVRGPIGYANRTLGRVARGAWHVAAAGCLAAAGVPAALAASPVPAPATQLPPPTQGSDWSPGADPSETTQAYVTRFYPRFLTGLLEQVGKANEIAGPDRMGPLWGVVVAPNDDTLYAQFRLDLSQGPQILTIPATTANYSVLSVDVFGDVFHTSIPSNTPGTCALVPPGFQGSLPQGATRITVPYSFTFWTIRADRFTGGTNSRIRGCIWFELQSMAPA